MKRTEKITGKNRLYIIILMVCLVPVINSCWLVNQKIGSGDVISRDVFAKQEYSRVVSNVPGKIILTDSPAPYISLLGDDNILDELKITFEDDTLYVEVNSDVCFSSYTLFIYIPVSRLTRLESLGAGDFCSESMLQTGNLDLVLKGSGNMQLQINSAEVNTFNEGSGDIILAGRCEKHNAQADGSGNILAAGLEARYANAHVNASGNIEIYSTHNLKARTVGRGLISYCGDPLHTELRFSVPGSITEM